MLYLGQLYIKSLFNIKVKVEVRASLVKVSEKIELHGRALKGKDRRSEERLIAFFAGSALNKCRIVKTTPSWSAISLCVRISIIRLNSTAMGWFPLLFFVPNSGRESAFCTYRRQEKL